MEEDRSPYNGKPYYCVVCGYGFWEYMSCELPDCRLESFEDAMERQRQHETGEDRDSTPY